MIRLTVVSAFIFSSVPILAFDYFTEPIDYWNKPKNENKQVNKAPKIKEQSFDWDKYKNPSNKEFFQEGNHSPPAPIMELARNPSDENIKNWFELVEMKNQLMARLQKRIKEYAEENSPKLDQASIQKLDKPLSNKTIAADPKRFRFRMYFESTCIHCKKMMDTLSDLSEMGYYVELKQVDKRPVDYSVPFPIIPADPEELKDKKIDSWPVLFIADTSKKQLMRINGYHPTANILSALSKP